MSAIPLVRVRYADSFAQSLNRLGAPTERLLNRVNLTGQILRKQHGLMPVDQLWHWTALAARYTGLLDIGLTSGLTSIINSPSRKSFARIYASSRFR
jgi:hypothetical protein